MPLKRHSFCKVLILFFDQFLLEEANQGVPQLQVVNLFGVISWISVVSGWFLIAVLVVWKSIVKVVLKKLQGVNVQEKFQVLKGNFMSSAVVW